jgi:hypothetical protein
MELLGNRVYMILPEMKESTLTVPEETKKKLQLEFLEKLDRLTVAYKGEGMGEAKLQLDKIKIGDEVFVNPEAARRATYFDINGKKHLCVSVLDIQHIW